MGGDNIRLSERRSPWIGSLVANRCALNRLSLLVFPGRAH